MANGFAPYLLLQGSQIFKQGYDGAKVTPMGFLEWLLSQGTPNIISTAKADGTGHVKNVRYSYRQRGVMGKSKTVDSCDIDAVSARLEAEIPSTLYRQTSIFFDDATIAQYEAEASKLINLQTKAVNPGVTSASFNGVMKEVYEIMIEHVNGLFGDINKDCLDLQASNFGTNVVYASNAAQTLNLPLSTTSNALNAGLTRLITDTRQNQIDIKNATIVGSGLIDGLMVQQMNQALGLAQNGVNQSRLSLPNYFYDPTAATSWGANQFAVLEKDAVQFLSVDRYVGSFAGVRGNSSFFNIKLPIVNSLGGTELSSVSIDCQFKYIDCPGTQNVDGVPTQLNRGWLLTMSKSYYAVNKPSDVFSANDVLAGVNGTLRYTATNV
jgi:hypothetical protein